MVLNGLAGGREVDGTAAFSITTFEIYAFTEWQATVHLGILVTSDTFSLLFASSRRVKGSEGNDLISKNFFVLAQVKIDTANLLQATQISVHFTVRDRE